MPEKKKHKKHQFLLGHVHTYIHTKETMKRNEYSEMNIKKCSPTYLWRSFILSWAFSQVNKLNSAGNWIEFVQRGRLTVLAEWNANSKQWKSKFSYPMCCWCWNLFPFYLCAEWPFGGSSILSVQWCKSYRFVTVCIPRMQCSNSKLSSNKKRERKSFVSNILCWNSFRACFTMFTVPRQDQETTGKSSSSVGNRSGTHMQ